MTDAPRKLIEVSLPLAAINDAAAEEKSVPRRGHPATLHLWWSRKPLAIARAVLFAQLVDDPSAHPDRYPTAEDQRRRREDLHALIGKLALWENSTNADVLAEAHKEILDSTGGSPPTILDPFAGGGALPLEAQRLGLNAVASDLNPVAVLINKALIEIPSRFAGKSPIFPGLAESQIRPWSGGQGLAADLLAYGGWIRDQARTRIGDLYPPAALPDGGKAPVIAWIWARTASCPNPRCRIHTPLVPTWWLSKKKGKEAYLVPTVVDQTVSFSIASDPDSAPSVDSDGTVGRTGARCVRCAGAIDLKHLRAEGRAGRLGVRLLATVAEGKRKRIYLPPSPDHESAALIEPPDDIPDGEISADALGFRVKPYGLVRYTDLFSPRQLTALATFSSLVREARDKVLTDAIAAGETKGKPLADGGKGAVAYADAVATYLAFAVSKLADWSSAQCGWINTAEKVRDTFARHSLPMVWSYAEIYPFSETVGNFGSHVSWVAAAVEKLPALGNGVAKQLDALAFEVSSGVISTDPPYYDNIGYSDLSDFFYVWLRHTVGSLWPALFGTILVPKADELVANPLRHNGNDGARTFFEDGFAAVFGRARRHAIDAFPITVFYAFKQSETTAEGQASAGWETLLEGMVRSGWMITGTWPMRSEKTGRMRSVGSNTLASSVVLALRPRPDGAATTDRRGFLAALHSELPGRLRELQQGAIAPVDLPQAAIGPGMAIFTRYSKVIEADGSAMSVRTALARINAIRDQVLWEMVGDFDAATRFAITWYRQHGYSAGGSGDANNVANAQNTSIRAMERAGILTSIAGDVTLIEPSRLPTDYDPLTDQNISAWEVLHHLIRILDSDGVSAAGTFLTHVDGRADVGIDQSLVKELTFLLYSVADGKRWTADAIAFNNIATSWGDLLEASYSVTEAIPTDPTFDFTTDDEDV